MINNNKHILWVDDEPWTIQPTIDSLGEAYSITTASSLSSALREMKSRRDQRLNQFDLLIIDVLNRSIRIGEKAEPEIIQNGSPISSGIEFAYLIRKMKFNSIIIFYTVVDDSTIVNAAKELGATYAHKRHSIITNIHRLLEDR